MRVVMRNPRTGLYFRNTHEWVDKPDTARDFFRTATAIFFAYEQSLLGMEVVLTFQDTSKNFVVAHT